MWGEAKYFGETTALHLPTSKLLVLYSSQYWQGLLPWDKRKSMDPSIPVSLTSDDYKNNLDPCVMVIRKQ